jgi:hypothetical protein
MQRRWMCLKTVVGCWRGTLKLRSRCSSAGSTGLPYATTDGQIRQKDVKISLAGTLTFAALRTAGVGVYTFDTFRGMLTYVATLPQSHPTAHVDLPWIPTTDPIFNK